MGEGRWRARMSHIVAICRRRDDNAKCRVNTSKCGDLESDAFNVLFFSFISKA